MKLTSLFLMALAATALAAAPKKFADLGKIKPIKVSSMKPGEAVVVLNVLKGFHIQANPASNPALIATTLTVSEAAGLAPGAPVYPAGRSYRSAATHTEVMAYEGKVEVKLPVAIGSASPGKRELTAKLRYQACNDETCFFPITTEVKIPVTVE